VQALNGNAIRVFSFDEGPLALGNSSGGVNITCPPVASAIAKYVASSFAPQGQPAGRRDASCHGALDGARTVAARSQPVNRDHIICTSVFRIWLASRAVGPYRFRGASA
jgi:hypothetical protein